MLWILLAVLAVVGAMIALSRRRSYESVGSEPWRASLDEDEPLDVDQIRRAEEEWLDAEEWDHPPEDDSWR